MVNEETIILNGPAEKGIRADVYIAGELGITRSHARKLIREGKAVLAGHELKSSTVMKPSFILRIEPLTPVLLDVEPEDLPLDIVYEDEDVVVVNKARGMVVHPAPGNFSGTLVNALLYHCDNLSDINGVIRPGIVHRLDKDTSGVMIVAKNREAHLSLSEQIQTKTCKREYIAIVRGNIKVDSGTIDTLIDRDKVERKRMRVVSEGGRRAITDYEVVERYGKYTIVRCALRTGRTHQIRVHMEYIGHPVVGDPKYSPQKTPFAIEGQALHSEKITFIHPRTGEVLTFTAALPSDMEKIITRLRNGQYT